MKKIVVIGIGNLGKRHVQSLLKSKSAIELICVDVVFSNKEEIENYDKGNHDTKLSFESDFTRLPKHLDLAVVATSSKVRLEVLENLLANCSVDYLILEKVLFQRVEEYKSAQLLIEKSNAKAWVNNTRRLFGSWNNIKRQLEQNDWFEYNVAGENWGLGCNGIHMFDLIHYLDPTAKVCKCEFDERIIDSKRNGYKELFGLISGEGRKCSNFSISCYPGDNITMTITIRTSDKTFVINEGAQVCYVFDHLGNVQKEDFEILYQSNLTELVANELFEKGECGLPSFEESVEEHLQIIEPMIEHFEKCGCEKGICPVT